MSIFSQKWYFLSLFILPQVNGQEKTDLVSWCENIGVKGNYGHPDHCRGFVECWGGDFTGWKFNEVPCAAGTLWDSRSKICNWDYTVAACDECTCQRAAGGTPPTTANPVTEKPVTAVTEKPVTLGTTTLGTTTLRTTLGTTTATTKGDSIEVLYLGDFKF